MLRISPYDYHIIAEQAPQRERKKKAPPSNKKQFPWPFRATSKENKPTQQKALPSEPIKGRISQAKKQNDELKEDELKDKEPQNVPPEIEEAALFALGMKSPAQQKYEQALKCDEKAENPFLFGSYDPKKYLLLKKEAIALLKDSVKDNHQAAMLALADLFKSLRSELLQADVIKSLKDDPRQANLFKSLENSLSQAVLWYFKYIELDPTGYRIAYPYFQLGLIYEKGGIDIEKNELLAIRYYEEAIKNRGKMPYKDKLVAQNVIGAASYQLALLLERGGKEFNPDFKRSFNLLKTICHRSTQAQFALARFYEKGQYVEKDFALAHKTYLKLANVHADSAYRYAQLHEKGVEENGQTIIPKHIKTARAYYKRAVQLDHPLAVEDLKRLQLPPSNLLNPPADL